MNFIIFAITYPFIWVLSRLPMRVLYITSDFLFLILYYIVGYRKKVVLENLKLSFPEKSEKELQQISKKFFKHFIDLIIESIKSFSISEKEILKRYKYKNPELINEYAKQGRNVFLVGAHLANWEWSLGLPLILNMDIYAAYTKLSNPFFEKKIRKSREKFGGFSFKTANAVRAIAKNVIEKKQGLYILLSDQSPQLNKTLYWRTFFGINVPVHTGTETLSKKFNFVVVNYVTTKIKRGYYETEFQLITDTPKEFENYQITDKYIMLTEENIKKQPELYLWSHRRFKHKDKFEEYKHKQLSE